MQISMEINACWRYNLNVTKPHGAMCYFLRVLVKRPRTGECMQNLIAAHETSKMFYGHHVVTMKSRKMPSCIVIIYMVKIPILLHNEIFKDALAIGPMLIYVLFHRWIYVCCFLPI